MGSDSEVKGSKVRWRRLRKVGDFLYAVFTSPWRAFKFICFTIGLAVLCLGIVTGLVVQQFYRHLPNLNKIDFEKAKVAAQTHVKDKLNHRRAPAAWVSLDQVNRELLYAIVTSEDASFFDHGGIDYEAVLTSFFHDLKARKYEYGGSTISQQVVKNLFLTDDKSLMRKLREIATTFRLERRFKKNEILEIYFNVAEFGPEIYGVKEAAEHYFHKAPANINAAEGAFLALMLPSPRKFYFTVYENQNLTKAKRRKLRRILGDMLANEYISPKQYREYMKYDYFSDTPGKRAPASHRKKRS